VTADGSSSRQAAVREQAYRGRGNTVAADRGAIQDALGEDAGAAAWLRAVADRIGAEAGTGPGHLNEDAVRPAAGALRDLRDALRRLAAEATGAPRPAATAPQLGRPEAIVTLNALATAWPELVWPAGGHPSGARHYHRHHSARQH
jgi:hypothetical protein